MLCSEAGHSAKPLEDMHSMLDMSIVTPSPFASVAGLLCGTCKRHSCGEPDATPVAGPLCQTLGRAWHCGQSLHARICTSGAWQGPGSCRALCRFVTVLSP